MTEQTHCHDCTAIKPNESTPLMTVAEAARKLGLSAHITKKLCESAELEAYRILGQWRISDIQVERFLLRNLNTVR